MYNKINDRVKGIANQVIKTVVLQEDFLAVDTETSELCCSDDSSIIFTNTDNIYENNLPEGITLDTLKIIDEYNKDFEAGILLGIGELTLLEMDRNSKITSSTSYTPMSDRKTLNTFICINEESEAVAVNSLFSFKSNVKENIPIERVTGELTQPQIVSLSLKELYIKALCECVSK